MELLFQHALLSIEQSLLQGRILLIADSSWSTKVAVEIMALSGLSTVTVWKNVYRDIPYHCEDDGMQAIDH